MLKHLLFSIVLGMLSLFIPQAMQAGVSGTVFQSPDDGIGETPTETGSTDAEVHADGWPAQYGGVMLQGFYWMSYKPTSLKTLDDSLNVYSKYFDLIWMPNTGKIAYGAKGMGYMPYYFFDQNSSFGSADSLRLVISKYKAKGTGFIEDVVVNHHASLNQNDYFTFPTERWTKRAGDTYTYKYLKEGEDYGIKTTDIVSNDDNYKTQAEADYLNKSITDDAYKIKLSENAEEEFEIQSGNSRPKITAEGFTGARDLDHQSANVQKIINAYEEFLLHDVGYTGFRYDVAKGFAPKHIAEYNANAQPRFSVAEVYDGNADLVKGYIDAWETTDGTHRSAAFDFPLKFGVMQKGFAANDFTQKTGAFTSGSNRGLINNRKYSRYAVTWVDNHDTWYPREDGTITNDLSMVTRNMAAANAYILAMPGTPCIFLKHWLDKDLNPVLKKMIMARKAAGITNQSLIEEDGYDTTDGDGYYAKVKGKTIDGEQQYVLLICGDVADANGISTSDYKLVSEGTNYKYYITPKAYETYQKFVAGTEAVPHFNDTSLDNTDPSDINTENSETKTIDIGKRHIYVESDATHVYLYACEGKNWSPKTGNFPGKEMKQKVQRADKNGKMHTFFYYAVDASDFLNIVLSTGETETDASGNVVGLNQTNDIKELYDEDIYLTFTPGEKSDTHKGKIAKYTNITSDITNVVKNDEVYSGYKAGKYTIYFKNNIGWYNPCAYVWRTNEVDNGDGTKTKKDILYSGAWDQRDHLSTINVDGQQYWAWSYTGTEKEEPQKFTLTFDRDYANGENNRHPKSVDLAFQKDKTYKLSLTEKDEKGRYKEDTSSAAAKASEASILNAWTDGSGVATSAPGVSNISDLFEGVAQAKPRREEAKETETLRIYFVNNLGYTDVHLKCWGGVATEGDKGDLMTIRPEKYNINGTKYDLYMWQKTVTKGALPDGFLIDNNAWGDGQQTSNVNKDGIVNGNVYIFKEAEKSGKPVMETKAAYAKPLTIYYDDSSSKWGEGKDNGGKIGAWVYDDNNNWTGGGWPGQEMTKISVAGKDLYAWYYNPSEKAIAGTPVHVIINNFNHGQQSKTQDWADEYVYNQTGSVSLSDFVAGSTIDPEAEKPVTLTVYYRNSTNFDKVYIYGYGGANGDGAFAGGWPGKEMTKRVEKADGQDTYQFVWSGKKKDMPTAIIFNNNAGKQTMDISNPVDGYIYTPNPGKTDGSGHYNDVASGTYLGKPATVYFANTLDWKSPYVWVWNANGNHTGGGWPGQAMEKITVNGNELWRWTNTSNVDGMPTQVIISDKASGKQTVDLDFKDEYVYRLSKDEEGGKKKLLSTVSLPNYKLHTVYLQNSREWTKPYVYAHCDITGTNVEYSGAEPSAAMEETMIDETKLWKWDYIGYMDEDNTKLVFSNGATGDNAEESEALNFKKDYVYVLATGTVADKTKIAADKDKSAALEQFRAKGFTVYFDNTVGWTNPTIWAWRGNTNYSLKGSEPGDPMTYDETLKKWKYTYTGDNRGYPSGLVISDGKEMPQSVDLEFVNNGIYELDINRLTEGDDKDKNPQLGTTTVASQKMQLLNQLYGREVNSKKISTLCLPFSLNSNELAAMMLKAYTFNRVENNEVFFDRVNSITARKPYLIIYTGQNSTTVFNSRIINTKEWTAADGDATNEFADAPTSNTSQWTFKGTLHNLTKTSDATTTYFGYVEQTKQFTQVTNGNTATIPATVCWFEAPTSKLTQEEFDGKDPKTSKAKKYNVVLSDDDTTTGIIVIPTFNGKGSASDVNAPMYNVAGQRVGNGYRGIVIQNGKKIIRK